MRESRGLTHTQVAEYLGITRQAYTNYENGDREIKTETLRKLVDFFNTSADYLLGTTDDPSSSTSNIEKPYDSLTEITQYIQQLGMKDMGFFDIEKWKNLTPEDVEELKSTLIMLYLKQCKINKSSLSKSIEIQWFCFNESKDFTNKKALFTGFSFCSKIRTNVPDFNNEVKYLNFSYQTTLLEDWITAFYQTIGIRTPSDLCVDKIAHKCNIVLLREILIHTT